MRIGGKILVDQLLIHGARFAYCVPGESYLPVLDALYGARERIELITCRHEAAAANMAEAYGKLTGTPGICFVTRGPGATHASIGVHTAFQDSTPLILFIGQVGSDFSEREAFQEIDYRRMFGPMAKWVAQIDRAERIPELVARAYQTATGGRMGPVVLALPEDVLFASTDVADARVWQQVAAAPTPTALANFAQLLQAAQRPLLLVGGSGWSAAACEDLRRFAEMQHLPVTCAFRFQDLFDNEHRNYVGDAGVGINPALAARIKAADLLICIGPRLGEMTTGGYTLVEPPVPRQTLIHLHAGAEEIGRVYRPAVGVVAGGPQAVAALRALEPLDGSRWRERTEAARADYLDNLRHAPMPGPVDLGEVMTVLRERLPDDAILTNGAGNYSVWAHRFYEFRRYRTCLAPTSGAMGYGAPAGVAAKLAHPERIVVSFNGDGCFLMNGQELATALQYGAATVFIVVDNGMYGTIRMHQERNYPARVIGTDLENPDFAALARSYGAHGERVERTEEFAPAFERALAAGRAALIHIRLDPEAITPRQSLSQIRKAGGRKHSQE